MMLEVAEAISEGLMMTQLPAAMAPPREQRDSDGVGGLTLTTEWTKRQHQWVVPGPHYQHNTERVVMYQSVIKKRH